MHTSHEPMPTSSAPHAAPADRAGRASAIHGIPSARASAVLPTLNDDGSRRWLRPRVSKGVFLSARRMVAYGLILLFAAIPLITLNGRPLVLLDIAARKFHILGTTFYPTDTLLVALLLVIVFLSIFWFTALFGRVWCGWACPQTVYMEFLYRPIERLCEGAPGRVGSGVFRSRAVGRVVKWIAYAACGVILSHIFLAYFVSWDQLRHWVMGSPADHPLGFAIVLFVSALMLLDFGILREQICLMCPYGRFQSVMLDRQSLIIRYDQKRGEPRGRKTPGSDVSLAVLPAARGDCIDCAMCVTTCPTGIDIRNGLQMECIGCAQCIDACNAVMDKIHKPRGLIRYSSQAAEQGQRLRIVRARVLLYPAVIGVLATIFIVALLSKGAADVTVLRGLGQPFSVLDTGVVRNTVRVRISNRTNAAAVFTVSAEGVDGVALAAESSQATVPAGDIVTLPADITLPPHAFRDGAARILVTVTGPKGFVVKRPFTMVGPRSTPQKETP